MGLAATTGRRPRIALVAGEASGDQLGAGLIAEIRRRHPDAELAGIGGPRMIAAGFEAWWPAERLAVMGIVEVLRHLPSLLRLRRDLVARLLAWRPDVYVGIDAPDFNLGVERRLKAAGVRTVHYVSPSVWAWREGRAARIGESADRVLCLFPMEPPIYARHGVDARFVGHPLAERFATVPDRSAARRALGMAAEGPVLALLPGSRLGEIRRLGADLLQAAREVAAALPDLRVLIPAANPGCAAELRTLIDTTGSGAAVHLIDGRAHEILEACDVALLASGAAALEAMLAKRPMVVAYRVAPLTYWLVRTFRLLKIRDYALPNVLAGETLVPELMQHDATPGKLAAAVLAWFRDPARAAALRPRFEALHAALRRDADREAADAVLELLAPAAPPA